MWRDFPARLAAVTGRQVISYDRLGFGLSTPQEAMPLHDFVEQEGRTALADVIRALGVERFVLLGHSVGGSMAMCAAGYWGERCTGVVTLSALSFVEAVTLEGIRAMQAALSDPAQMAKLERFHGPRAAWTVRAWTQTWLSPAFADWSLDSRLSSGLSAPLLAIHGDRDEYGSAAQPQRLLELAARGGQLRILSGGGHFPHREQPQVVLDVVADFLRQVG